MLVPLILNLGPVVPPAPSPTAPPPAASAAVPFTTVTVDVLLDQIAVMVQEDGSTYGGIDWPTGLWTVEEITGYINSVSKDFVLRTQIMKVATAVSATTSARIYDNPTYTMQLDRIAFNQKPLYRTNKYMLDRETTNWRIRAGMPKQYHQDMLATKTFELDRGPTSSMTGLGYNASTLYGTVRQMSGSFTYNASLPAGGGGGIFRYAIGTRAYNGVLPRGRPFAGTLRQMLTGVTNFEVLATRLPDEVAIPEDLLRVPDFCVMYIKYGVLQRMLEKEGEGQDLTRAAYCRQRYNNGVEFFRRLMSARHDSVGQQSGVPQ